MQRRTRTEVGRALMTHPVPSGRMQNFTQMRELGSSKHILGRVLVLDTPPARFTMSMGRAASASACVSKTAQYTLMGTKFHGALLGTTTRLKSQPPPTFE